MEIINRIVTPINLPKNTIITIGNFDGIHLGHQKILKFLIAEAKNKDLFSLVLTFSPHPEKILGKGKIKLIQTLDQRLETIKNFGIQGILVTPFDEKFSNLSSEEFVQKILIDTLKVKEIVIGESFRFGKDRKGDINTLHTLGSRYGFKVHKIPSVFKDGIIVSSSHIRNLLQKGRIEKVNTSLGRFYEIAGKVIEGKARGKVLGFPTANIETENDIIPLGVYISQVRIKSDTFPSVTNVGTSPTFNQGKMQIESYIINFNENLYGRKISINFIKKIRDEMKFETPADLSLQIKKDLEEAKSYFRLKN